MARIYETVLGKVTVSTRIASNVYGKGNGYSVSPQFTACFRAGNHLYHVICDFGKVEKVGKKFTATLDIQFVQKNNFYGPRPVAPIKNTIGEYSTLSEAVIAVANAADAAIKEIQKELSAEAYAESLHQLAEIEKANAEYLAAQEIAAAADDAQATEQVAAESVSPQAEAEAEAIAPAKKPRDAGYYKLRAEHKALCDKKLEIMRQGKNKNMANAYINQKFDVLREKLDEYAPESEKQLDAEWVKVGDSWRLWGFGSRILRYSSNNEFAKIQKNQRTGYDVFMVASDDKEVAIGNYKTRKEAQLAAEQKQRQIQCAEKIATDAEAVIKYNTCDDIAGICEAKFVTGAGGIFIDAIIRIYLNGGSVRFYRQHKDIGGFDMYDGNINVFVEKIKNHILRHAKTL